MADPLDFTNVTFQGGLFGPTGNTRTKELNPNGRETGYDDNGDLIMLQKQPINPNNGAGVSFIKSAAPYNGMTPTDSSYYSVPTTTAVPPVHNNVVPVTFSGGLVSTLAGATGATFGGTVAAPTSIAQLGSASNVFTGAAAWGNSTAPGTPSSPTSSNVVQPVSVSTLTPANPVSAAASATGLSVPMLAIIGIGAYLLLK